MGVKLKFTWSNEDFLLIAGSMTTMASIHFNASDPLFPLTLGAVFKGLFSILGINMTQTSDEDLILMIGGFVTLGGIHFDFQNPLFWLTVGAILKAGFGIFGINPASPIPVPPALAGTPVLAAAASPPRPASTSARQGSLS